MMDIKGCGILIKLKMVVTVAVKQSYRLLVISYLLSEE